MNIISRIYYAVKAGNKIEDCIPEGSDARAWSALIANYDPAAKPKRKPARRTSQPSRSKRSQKAAMDSAVGWATVELVKRVNEIPFQGEPGQGSDEEGTEADLGIQSPF